MHVRKTRALAASAIAVALATTAACGSGSADGGDSGAGKKESIYLDINGTFNQHRVQMKQVVQYAAKHKPLGSQVDYHFVNSPQDVSGQRNDLNNIINNKPDAIVLNAATATGLNPQVKRACGQGITVVSFDNTVTEPCAYKVTVPLERDSEITATAIAEHLGGKGKVVIDQGLVGSTVSDLSVAGWMKALKKYPGIKVVGKVESKYTPGLMASQLAPILSAHPDVSAVFTVVVAKPVLNAFSAAGLPAPKALALLTITNEDIDACTSQKVACVVAPVPPYLSASALKVAVDLNNGDADKAKHDMLIVPPLLSTDPSIKTAPGFPDSPIVPVTAIPEAGPSLTFPIAPSWLDIPPTAAAPK